MFCVIVFLLVQLALRLDAQQSGVFSMQPEPLTQTLTFGSIANYTCIAHNVGFGIGWSINIEGEPRTYTDRNIPLRFGITVEYQLFDRTTILHIPIRQTNGVSTNTRIACAMRGDNIEVHSREVTIIIQGLLDAVENVRYEVLEPGREVSITWTAPNTLDVSDTDPDITYCIETSTGLDLCDINETSHTLTFESGQFTPCNDSLMVVIVPKNGIHMQNPGEITDINVHMFEGVADISDTNIVQVNASEANHNGGITLKFVLTLPIQANLHHCSQCCQITAPNETHTIVLKQTHGVVCSGNTVTFDVSDNSPLKLKRLYHLNLTVGNAARCASGGVVNISTHSIQKVNSISPDDPKVFSKNVVLEFAQNTLSQGASVAFFPTEWTKEQCESLTMVNLQQHGDLIVENIAIPNNGSYVPHVYTIGSSNQLDRNPIPVNKRMPISIKGRKTAPVNVRSSRLLDVKHDGKRKITISLRNPEVGRVYSVVLVNENDSTTQTLELSLSKEVLVAEGIPYCLILYLHNDDGIMNRDPEARTHIPPEPHPGDDKNTGIAVIVITIIIGIIIIGIIIIVVIVKVKPWEKNLIAPKRREPPPNLPSRPSNREANNDDPSPTATTPAAAAASPTMQTENKVRRPLDLSHTLTIDSQQIYSWPKTGFKLYLPTPLSEDIHGKSIHLKTNVAGIHHLPPDCKLVSAIYSITTDLKTSATLELEHCYRGDLKALTFVYCESHQPPFHFKIASKEEYKCSFTSTHGCIETSHFSKWAIAWKNLKSWWFIDYVVDVSFSTFYRVSQNVLHIEVDIVIIKALSAHLEVVKENYEGWKLYTTRTARFSKTCAKVCVLDEWQDISNGWKLIPKCNPKINKSVIEDSNHFDVIELLFEWKEAHRGTSHQLEYKVMVEGLEVAGSPAFVNLIIPRHSLTTSTNQKPNMTNLTAFPGTSRVLNITEEIGNRYRVFGIQLLNDESGSYVDGLANQLRGDFKEINCRILVEWIGGKPGARPCTWKSLTAVLKDIELNRLAREIENSHLYLMETRD